MKSSNRQLEGDWVQHLWFRFARLGPVPRFSVDSQVTARGAQKNLI